MDNIWSSIYIKARIWGATQPSTTYSRLTHYQNKHGEIMLEISTNNLNEAEPSSESTSINYNFNFFTTSTTKLVLMSIATFGFYELYWFYKNWVAIKNAGKKCNPLLRAFFTPLFAYSCFKHIKESMNQHKVFSIFPVGLLAISYIILEVIWRLPDPYWLVSFLTFLPLIRANNAALAVNKAQSPDFVNNNRFSIWNILMIVVGGTLFVFGMIGTIFPETSTIL